MRKRFVLLFAVMLILLCVTGCDSLLDLSEQTKAYDKSESLASSILSGLNPSNSESSKSEDSPWEDATLAPKDAVPTSGEAEAMLEGRSESGFDLGHNQTLDFHGMRFSFPQYYDVLSEDSTEERSHYYPHETEYYSSLVFWTQALDWTQQAYIDTRSQYADSLIEEAGPDAVVLRSEEKTIAGLPGWIVTYYLESDRDVGNIKSRSFVYSEDMGTIFYIDQIYDSNDESSYDYLGDYEKVLEQAIVLPKEIETTPFPTPAPASPTVVSEPPTEREPQPSSSGGAHGGGGSVESPQEENEFEEESVGELVWIPTNGGTKYHSRSSCSKMKNPVQVPLKTAISQGFGPCKRCY